MNIIAVCNTPLQLICALNLKRNRYINDTFDIIISDHMPNSRFIAESSNKFKIFDSALYAETFMLCRGKEQFFSDGMKGKYQRLFCREKLLNKIIDIHKKYDVMLFNNFDLFNRLLYQVLYKKNKALKAYIIEDGYSSYFAQGWEWEKAYRKSLGVKSQVKKAVFGEIELAANLNGQFVYSPELVQWKAPFERLAIPKISLSDKAFLTQLNQLFGYDKMEDRYDTPIIFFEESFRKEGYDIGDIELVEAIADIVGKENIMIKRHPRNDDNTFEQKGYKVNKNTVIPWEVIIMNNPDLQKKILVTICSGAAATPYTMFNMSINSVILLKLMKNREKINYEFYDIYFNYMDSAVFKKYPNVFYEPRTMKELRDYFMKWKEENVEKQSYK